jgi:hypothetical protein
VLVDTSGVAFVDFDGFCLAEPANDIGRFRASLRAGGLVAPDGRHPPLSAARRAVVDELVDVFLDRYEERFEEQGGKRCTWRCGRTWSSRGHSRGRGLVPS